MRPIRRSAVTTLLVVLAACGGDAPPLPPLAEAPGYQRLLLDTAGNLVMRRLAMWVDTARATRGDGGQVTTTTRMQTDMKLGSMSIVIDFATEYDCAGRRMRLRSVRRATGTVKGRPLPDSLARQMADKQGATLRDSTWRTADPALLATLCRRAGVAVP